MGTDAAELEGALSDVEARPSSLFEPAVVFDRYSGEWLRRQMILMRHASSLGALAPRARGV